jgi:hypothetical protein
MQPIRQYKQVRVTRLLHPRDHYDGWGLNQRAPAVGDVGTVVDILKAPGVPASYVVECCGPGGDAIWLGDFSEQELAPVLPS